MALLTSTEIATALEETTFSINIKSINGYVIQDVARRDYPSIDVENITGQEQISDVPTSNTKQTYLIHLYYKIVGFGNLDEPDVQTLENEIFETIDSLQDTTTKITIIESWQRKHSVEGTPNIQSTLRVVTDEIFSTSGDGIRGDQITITFPTLGTVNVINLINDSITVEKNLDLIDDGEEIFTLKHLSGLLDVEIELTTTTESQIDTLLAAGDDISITLTKGGQTFVKTANLITRSNSSTRSEIQTTVISMNIKTS